MNKVIIVVTLMTLLSMLSCSKDKVGINDKLHLTISFFDYQEKARKISFVSEDGKRAYSIDTVKMKILS